MAQAPGQAPVYRALISLLNSAQAGATLSVDSPRPLAVGSLLSALVQGDQSLRFVPLSGRQDQLSIAQQLMTQQNRQASLPGLLDALQQLTRSADAPGDLRASAERLLAGLPDVRQLADAKGVAQALGNSGAFLEAKLLGLPSRCRHRPQGPPAAAGGAGTEPAARHAKPGSGQPGRDHARRGTRSPGPARTGQPQATARGIPAAVAVAECAGRRRRPATTAAPGRSGHSRLQSHAMSSLQQSGTLENGNLQTTWQTEVPIRHGQEFIPLQVKLQREETPRQQADREKEAADSLRALWRIDLAFDLPRAPCRSRPS